MSRPLEINVESPSQAMQNAITAVSWLLWKWGENLEEVGPTVKRSAETFLGVVGSELP